ncbi:ribonuclease H-like domain-containing protein [Rhizophagus irregularis DAOM 181602=DAOM 197198]|nr:ribonuclease H-like domain-containing protein [Rhizophagus irregularis DAOM 181602=DAOM 197198]
MGGDKLSSADLIFQIQSFYLRKKEYNIPYSASRGDVLTWWILYNSVHSEENYIQKLALKILAITPYNARFEKLEAMVKLYRYYITNAQKELKDVTEIEKWVNINNLELKKLLNIEVNVVIELHLLPVINHGSNVFDVEATVDKILSS